MLKVFIPKITVNEDESIVLEELVLDTYVDEREFFWLLIVQH